jgi:hypothetical protein
MRPPLPIIAWCGFHTVKAVWSVIAFVGAMPGQTPSPVEFVSLMASVTLTALAIVGLWLMRKWGVMLLAALLAGATLAMPMSVWWARYPLTGPWVSVAWIALFAATCAVYWKKMSWNFFGPSDAAGEGKRYA